MFDLPGRILYTKQFCDGRKQLFIGIPSIATTIS